MSENKRSSLSANKKIKNIDQILDKFTSKQFLTSNSLFNNLFSSQDMKIDLSQNQFLKTLFNSKYLTEKSLYQFLYYHRRQKKLVFYYFIRQFLVSTSKLELVLMLNNEKIDLEELQLFLQQKDHKLWQEFSKRVIIYTNTSQNVFVFNLQWLSQLMKKRQFLKAVIICDINSFESNDKTSAEKYYKRLPRELLTITFRKDLYDYKLLQKSSLSYLSDNHQDVRQLNEKIVHYLHKKSQNFNLRSAMITPFESIYTNAKTIEDTYKSILLRESPQGDTIQQIVYSSQPFRVESVRQN